MQHNNSSTEDNLVLSSTTTVEVNELMSSVTSTQDVDPLAEPSNIFSEIGCKVVAKQKRESGKGRLVDVWSLN